MTNTVYNFVKHCLTDDEFDCGGIPTKEKYYLKKLGWTPNDEITNRFYNAMYELKKIQDEQREIEGKRSVMRFDFSGYTPVIQDRYGKPKLIHKELLSKTVTLKIVQYGTDGVAAWFYYPLTKSEEYIRGGSYNEWTVDRLIEYGKKEYMERSRI